MYVCSHYACYVSVYLVYLLERIKEISFVHIRYVMLQTFIHSCNGAVNLCQESSTVSQSYATEREIDERQEQACTRSIPFMPKTISSHPGEMCGKTIMIIIFFFIMYIIHNIIDRVSHQ